MTLEQIKQNNVTDEEFDLICEWTDALSDFCEMCDGTWGIEWDGMYGRHWDRYATEAEAEAALDRHSARQLELLPEARAELARRKAEARKAANEAAAKKRALREARTLGGQHDVLGELLVKMREEVKK